MFRPRAGSRPRVKRAEQKIYLGSEERDWELESSRIIAKITAVDARGGGKDGDKAGPCHPIPTLVPGSLF